MGTRFRRSSLIVTAAAAVAALAGCSSGAATGTPDDAAEFPTERIRFIVPYAAGGPTDVTARALAPCLSEELGQEVVPENIEGGSGAVGLQQMINAPADGYTIAIATVGMVVLAPLQGDLGYSREDITAIGTLVNLPVQLIVTPDSPFSTAEEFFEYAKANPGELKVGVSGASTPQALELERLGTEYGVELTVVPFDGSAGATTAILGGHVDAAFINDADDVLARTEDGSFVPLAVGSPEPQPHQPDVPTLASLGYEDITLAVSNYALAGPAGLDDGVTDTVSAALETCSSDPATVEAIGERFIPEEYQDGAAFEELLIESEKVYKELLGD